MRCVKHNTVSHWTDKLRCTWTGKISCLVLIYIHFLYSTLNHTWNTHKTISFVYFVERATGKLINLSNKQAAWHKLCLHSSLHRLFILTNMSAKPTKYQGFGQLWEIWKVMEFPDIILIWFEVWESHRNWVNMKIFQFSQKDKMTSENAYTSLQHSQERTCRLLLSAKKRDAWLLSFMV